MAQLEYFSANDQAAFTRRRGRILAAGVLLLLVGLGFTGLSVLAGVEFYRVNHRYSRVLDNEWIGMLLMWLVSTVTAVATAAGGIGLLKRRRWGGATARLLTSLWLSYGVAIACANGLLTAIEISRGEAWYF